MKKTDYIQLIDGAERRTITHKVERRQESDGDIHGVAAVVGQTTDLGWFEERIEPGAFDDALGDDVRALFNHEPNLILGRTKSGTLKLYTNQQGDLAYSYKTPDRTYARDLEDSIASGDVDQSSFAFTIKEEMWTWAEKRTDGGTKDLRTILKIDRLYDVSPVTYPAYHDTTVAKRNHDTLKQEHERAREQEQEENAAPKLLGLIKRKHELLKLRR